MAGIPTTFAELVAAVGAWIDDTTVDAAEKIALAESEMRDRLLIGRAEVSATLAVAANVALPADLGELVSLRITTNPVIVPRYVDPTEFDDVAPRLAATGVPSRYTMLNGQLRFAPAPDGAYSAAITYRRDLPALSATNTTNWLLTRYPHAYLHGALKYALLFGIEDERAAQFDGLFQGALAAIREADARRRTGPRPRMAMRPLQ